MTQKLVNDLLKKKEDAFEKLSRIQDEQRRTDIIFDVIDSFSQKFTKEEARKYVEDLDPDLEREFRDVFIEEALYSEEFYEGVFA